LFYQGVTQQLSFSLIFLFSFHKLCELLCEYEHLLKQKKIDLDFLCWNGTMTSFCLNKGLGFWSLYCEIGVSFNLTVACRKLRTRVRCGTLRIWALRVLSVGAGTWEPRFCSTQGYFIQQTQGTARASWHYGLWISMLETSVNMNLVGQKIRHVLEYNI
jgi:hypothetical protein